MSRALPAKSIDLLNGRHEASGIEQACNLAFWLVHHNEDAALFHLRVVHEKFAELADKLGYDITERAPAETDDLPQSLRNEAAL